MPGGLAPDAGKLAVDIKLDRREPQSQSGQTAARFRTAVIMAESK
jgi:hypothetical protein